MFHRLGCLRAWVLYSVGILSTVGVRAGCGSESTNPSAAAAAATAVHPTPPNPFETVPQGKDGTACQAGPTRPARGSSAAPEARESRDPAAAGKYYRSHRASAAARRVRQDTLQSLVYSKKGDRLDEDTWRTRDFMQLWNSGRFEQPSDRNG